MMTTHQTHENSPKGQTDSSYKLTRLKMPANLTGKTVLDIGCNEGFFCNQALQRNAEKVIGIDKDTRFLTEAKERYSDPRITYVNQGWDTLPEGLFDLILWTSAMHYELDPQKVLCNIADSLSPAGTFILECGVYTSPRKEMLYSLRHDGGLWYPTLPLIEDMLTKAGLSYRMVSQAEVVGTDPIPRVVFHCTRKVPTVMVMAGTTRTGKTSLASLLFPVATKVISLDQFVARIWGSKWVHTPLEKFIQETTTAHNLGGTYDGIDTNELTDAYITLLCKGIAATDELVVLEGYMTDKQREALLLKLKNRARVWIVDRA